MIRPSQINTDSKGPKADNPPTTPPIIDAIADIQQAAAYLGVSVNTLYGWVHKRKVPYIKIGRLLKFDLKELSLWVVSHKVALMSH